MHKRSRKNRRRKNDPTFDAPNKMLLRAPNLSEWSDSQDTYGDAVDPFLIERAEIDGVPQTLQDLQWEQEEGGI